MFAVKGQHGKSLGYTLVEMLVTISILAILAALAAPSMTPFVARQQLKALTQDLSDTLQLARSESLVNGSAYRISSINNNWSSGWNLEFRLNSGNYAVFKRYAQNNARLLISATSRSGNSNQVFYDENARVSSIMRFEIKHSELDLQPYCVEVASSGNVQVIRGQCDAF